MKSYYEKTVNGHKFLFSLFLFHDLEAAYSYYQLSDMETDVFSKAVKSNELQKYEDYLEIQKMWLNKEVVRYNKAKDFMCSVMDFGAEEIEFYTLNYPKTIGQEWEIETALHKELEQVRKCMEI